MAIFKNPKKEYNGKMEDYPMENYPDYVPGKGPKTEILEEISFNDEVQRIYGKPWGSQGIGKLREVMLIKPTDHEMSPLFKKYKEYFLLRGQVVDINRLRESFQQYGELLEKYGVNVHWMEISETWGPYGPMRKLFMRFPLVIRGGAILSRIGHAGFMRGVNVDFQRFFTQLGCPILLTVHGKGICEVGGFVQVAEDVVMGFRSCAANDEGLTQVAEVLKRQGVKEFHISNCTTIYQDYESGGEFHIDMHFGVVDNGVAVIYPGYLDYQTYKWLVGRRFKLIEVPRDEHHKLCPANLVLLEPGLVIMEKGATETIKRVRKMGVEVIEFDSSGLHVGTNGLHCVTHDLIRDPGPRLEDIKW